jgi:hypothetical protein
MPLPKLTLAAGGVTTCSICHAANQVLLYPALVAQRPAAAGEAAAEGESACFDHPGKRAVAACNQCGRFVCQLCAIEMEGGVWCPSCVAMGAGRARTARAEPSRTLYDSIALTAPLGAFLIWPLTFIAGPTSVVLSIVKWRQPLSLVRHSRWRFVAAIILGLAETIGWIAIIFFVIARLTRGISVGSGAGK